MCLSDLRRGQKARVDNIPDENLRAQLLRFGISNGTSVTCHTRLPLGPIVLQFGGQEIALGRQLAKQITVSC